MGLSYSYDARIVLISLVGDYTTAQLRELVLAALDDPACPPRPVLLFDMRASLAVARRSAGDIAEMARFLSSISSRYDRRLAMVVSSEVAYGLMRMGSALAEPGGIVPSVFREMEPARAWLLED